MNDTDQKTATMTSTVKLTGTQLVLNEGDTVLVQTACNQPNSFTKYFAYPAIPEGASAVEHNGAIWVEGEDAILVEREDFELDGPDRSEIEDREAARLYRAHCLDAEFKVNWFATDWPHELMRAFLLGPVAREAAIWPECKVRTANIARTEGWTPETRVNVALRSTPTSPHIGHWDCKLTRYREVAR